MFFSFDGIDGVGKSTQMRLFVDWLREGGLTGGAAARVVECRDPGSTPLGEALRKLLLESGPETPIGDTAEMLLYMAARAQLVEEVVRPALEAGANVVSDRFLLANVVYQGHVGGLGREPVLAVGELAIRGLSPDLVFLLDMDPVDADRRRGREPDRLESRGLEYRKRLRKAFLAEAVADPARIRVIDASGPVEGVQRSIRDQALEFRSDR
ncbi:MAG: dTMP kinase [Lacipirellulaceae bacterium]